MSSFNKMADHNTDKYLPENASNLYCHTVDAEYAERLVRGYLTILRFLSLGIQSSNICVDIGCGVGNITQAFKNKGLNIYGIEYGDIAVAAAHRENPTLDVRTGDITKFLELDTYDFIFSREVYIFTRVNAFTDQLKVISDLIKSLKPNGVLMISASRVSRPHCADFPLIMKTLRNDSMVNVVSQEYYAQMFTTFWPIARFKLVCKLIKLILAMPIWYQMKVKGFWSPHYIYVISKKA